MTFSDLLHQPSIHVRNRDRSVIHHSRDGMSFVGVVLKHLVRVGPYVRDFETAHALLAAGAPLAELRAAVVEAGGVECADQYLLWLERFNQLAGLEFPLVDRTGERAVIVPQQDTFVPTLAQEVPAVHASLDRFAFLRRLADVWLLESPLVAARLQFADLAVLDADVVRRALDGLGFLDTSRPHGDARRIALAQWEFHDLLFHTHERRGWNLGPVGAAYPFVDRIEPLPAVRPSWPGDRITLPRAPDADAGEPFAAVLERRRSERSHDAAHPISLADLGSLLDRAARIRSSGSHQVHDPRGRTATVGFTRRPYPTGGASYELEIYAIVDRCIGLEPGCYHYEALEHELVRISGHSQEVERLLRHAGMATPARTRPQILLAVAARFARVMWKYRAISYGIILRDVGGLYQTLYLAATELGLSPCAIGSGDCLTFARATGLDPLVEGMVGEFILGGQPVAS